MREMPYGAVQALLNRAPGDLVRLYSYQSHHAWERAQEIGYLTGCQDHIESDDHGWSGPYGWMRDQMGRRIEGFSGDYPVWAWAKRPSTKPKPRKYRGTRENIRITALVPRSRILFSDYEAWHSVLNDSLCCDTESEWDAFYDSGRSEEPDMVAIKEASWQRVFEFVSRTNQEVIHWRGASKHFRVQACVDRISLDEIVAVRTFDEK